MKCVADSNKIQGLVKGETTRNPHLVPLDQASRRLFATFLADAINLEGMPGGEVVVFAADLLLELPYFRRKELDRATAFGAHHVMVAAPVVLVLKTRDAVVEGDLAGESAIG